LDVVVASVLWLGTAAAHAEQGPIATDRPDFVESIDVVGTGRVQLEAGLSLERDLQGEVSSRVVSTPFLLRIGLDEHWEVRLETDGAIATRVESQGFSASDHGLADISLGLKRNIREPAGSRPGVALLMHVDLNSGSGNLRGEGLRPSLRAVAEWEMPGDTSLGVMPGVLFDRSASHYFMSGIFAVTFAKQWTARAHTFVEVAGQRLAHADDGGNVVTFDAGWAYLLTRDGQIDVAAARGATANAPDWSYGAGISWRF
jgi:hypothetical protein